MKKYVLKMLTCWDDKMGRLSEDGEWHKCKSLATIQSFTLEMENFVGKNNGVEGHSKHQPCYC